MKYRSEMNESGVYKMTVGYTIDPADFLECETEIELIESVEIYIEDNAEYPEISEEFSVELKELKYNIPKGFIEEWKLLKQLSELNEK